MIVWKRALRTLTSERFLATRGSGDIASVDLHYLQSGKVVGTIFLFKSAGWKEDDVPAILRSLDEDMLPDVDLTSGSLTYTVVHGDVWGNFEASGQSSSTQ